MSSKSPNKIEAAAFTATRWVGSVPSLILHTLLFIGSFLAVLIRIIPFDEMLLVLTTVVSLEAIYLSIFIQMSVNRTTESLVEVEHDIDEMQEDVGEIQEDIDEMQKDVDEIQKDVDEIQEDVDEIQEDVEELTVEEEGAPATRDPKLASIQARLKALLLEIEQLDRLS